MPLFFHYFIINLLIRLLILLWLVCGLQCKLLNKVKIKLLQQWQRVDILILMIGNVYW